MLNRTPRGYHDEIDPEMVDALLRGQLADPFAILGPHDTSHGRVVRVFQPEAEAVDVLARESG